MNISKILMSDDKEYELQDFAYQKWENELK